MVETVDKDPPDHEDLRDQEVAGYQIIFKKGSAFRIIVAKLNDC